ncbi:phosphoribosylformylglycinamidine cyclo-ligase [Cryptosporangium aurantiacum]|uniref:phosphoribosylformylglycinamidine cyclo-ligase n=1 Tax=Cryptosporangium aurantiacum TaxID=134849 RepID=UPI003CCB9874
MVTSGAPTQSGARVTRTSRDATSGGDAEAGASYRAAGVDIEAGDRAVELMRSKVKKTFRPEVVGNIGGFAGLFAFDTDKYKKPVLASSTDGVGTKLAIAQQMNIHDTVGIDLVAMVVDDLVVCGAEPLFLQDYIAIGKVVPEKVADIVGGIADGCRWAGCALLGGETAEHPGLLSPDEYDIAATGVGVVDADSILGADRIKAGDQIIALASSGLHSNGYSLVRHALLADGKMRLDQVVPELGRQRTLGEDLLTPTTIYAQACLAVIEECEVHALAHITGGGLAGNVVRVIGEDVDAVIDRATWRPQPIFDLIGTIGRVTRPELERTFNMGVGMVVVVPPDQADRAVASFSARGVKAWVAGEIVSGTGNVRLVDSHPS